MYAAFNILSTYVLCISYCRIYGETRTWMTYVLIHCSCLRTKFYDIQRTFVRISKELLFFIENPLKKRYHTSFIRPTCHNSLLLES